MRVAALVVCEHAVSWVHTIVHVGPWHAACQARRQCLQCACPLVKCMATGAWAVPHSFDPHLRLAWLLQGAAHPLTCCWRPTFLYT